MMRSYSLIAIVDEKHRILIDLPNEIPAGFVEITLHPIDLPKSEVHEMNSEKMEVLQFAEELLRGVKERTSGVWSLSVEEAKSLSPLLKD